jgi:hypothetical protein
VRFDSWYSRLDNLKFIRDLESLWLTQLKSHRQANPAAQGLQPLAQVDLSPSGTVIHLKGYGLVRLFKVAASDGSREYWATNDRHMPALAPLR